MDPKPLPPSLEPLPLPTDATNEQRERALLALGEHELWWLLNDGSDQDSE